VAARFSQLACQGGWRFAPLLPVNYATGKIAYAGIPYYEWLENTIISREYRVAKVPLAFGRNSSQDPRFLLTLAMPLKES